MKETPSSDFVNATSVTLLHRVQQNIPDAWEDFLSVYETMMRRWLVTQGANEHDVNDVLQEIFTYIYVSLPKFIHNGRMGAFRNWLRKVTINRLREFWRKEKRRTGNVDWLQLSNELEQDSSEIHQNFEREHQQFVVNHLVSLVENRFQRKSIEVFREVVLNQREPKVVADEFEMTVNHVRVTQFRVMSALRQIGVNWNDD